MKKRISKVIALVMALCLVLQLSTVSAFATTPNEKPYDSFAIYGDSICLGFSTEAASMGDTVTYDIEGNSLMNKFPHCYPSVFANRIGLDTDYSDGTTDLLNFGVCAAWSSDMYQMLTDPYYQYIYNMNNYDENTIFVLPEEYTGWRFIVDTEAEGYDVGDMGTWQYVMDGWDYAGMEEYTIPAGYPVHVGYMVDYWGTSYLTMNSVISEKYSFVSEKCLDNEGHFIDTNGDGKVDSADIIYYPAVFNDLTWGYDPDSSMADTLGRAIANPQFTKYYYDMMVDGVKNSDLVALAIGGNDIYHSFMPYQQNSGTLLGNLVYWISYALQMNMSVCDILQMINDPGMWEMIVGDMNVMPMAADEPALLAAAAPLAAPADAGMALGALVDASSVQDLLEYYSKDHINAYLADVVDDYKVNTEKIIQRMLELKQDDAELVLMGHFNPYGLQNYLEMLSENLESGKLFEDVSGDVQTLTTLLQAIIGTPEDYQAISQMSAEEQAQMMATAGLELDNLLNVLQNNPDLSDAELTKLVVNLSYPLSVLVVGTGLSDVYTEMNSFVQEMADKYGLAYVDVSGAPTSGRYDPHPTAAGHKWIADRLYETVVPSISASVCRAGTGRGTITAKGTSAFRLHDTMEYRFVPASGSKISAVYVDGELLNPSDYNDVYTSGTYVFEDITQGHTISVQFDKTMDFAPKYTVDVLGSYAGYQAGEGLYKEGDKVTINAGTLEGYQFCGWLTNGVELKNASATKTSFVMPGRDVKIAATWRPVSEEPETQFNTLTFNTNGGTPVADVIKAECTEIPLNAVTTVKEGYTFLGWYYDEALTLPADTVTLYNNTTVYAKWIANDLVDAEDPMICAGISLFGTGHGTISSLGWTKVEMNGTKEYRMVPAADSKISAIFVDGQWLNPYLTENAKIYQSGVYTFEDVTGNHAILVQFDKTLDTTPRYMVDVLGSYAANEAGEGLYKPGSTVYINAGRLDGYVFAGWVTDGVELADPTNASTTFVMPAGNVHVMAKWTPVYNLYFDTNGGSQIVHLTAIKGTELDLTSYVPTKDGYKFVGWYADEALQNAVTNVTLKGNMTVYAKWIPVDVPATGDHSNMGLWIALMGAAAIGVAGVIVCKKKKENDAD